MKNKTFISIAVFAISLLIIPQMTFAVWWNPGTWKIFNRKAEVKTEQKIIATSTPNNVISQTEKATTTEKIEQKSEEAGKQKVAASLADTSAQKDDQFKEIEKLKKEVETLKQKQSEIKIIEKITENPTITEKKESSSSQAKQDENIVTLPNGAVVEVDANGNIVRTIKEAPQTTYTSPEIMIQSQTSATQILSVNVTPTITSAKIEWQTDKPTESKVFLSGGGFSSKVYNSESGFSTRHSASFDGLSASTDYSYEIEAITRGVAVKKNGVFLTNSNKPTKISLSDFQSYPGLYCSKTTITVHILDQSGEEMLGQPIEVKNTYIDAIKTGVSPFVADFGFNAMKEANFSLKIKSGVLESERIINVYEPNFQVIDPNQPDQSDGTYMDQNNGIKLNKTATGFECTH
ncbi:MAG: hypothetical protein COV02_01790 [Candidatus Terrybacteria bacterium CG10_big_fil_rev_8_21_14_0_10_41_10]|uniref:Fibronectin type-III domain-containing protein n=1 Tax=Candidatus Terrybacteria bacterium CG10_big_fil_rev_8_21_14_0_10_41_10 TaxID=1975026 RepID=A0A2M8LAD6_9BACT|nr:MAG: hypothetical protein COV02_01790 [Candidatus Terrybacteria bacterium CG10_big_fil_rev_8_21_14_0_10_41_10]